jgi:hypothetical protein
MRRLLFSLSAAVLAGHAAVADDITPASGFGPKRRPLVAPLYGPPLVACPPAMPLAPVPVAPIVPGMPPTTIPPVGTPPTSDPNQPPTPPAPPPATNPLAESLAAGDFARASEAGTLTARAYNANLFGDIIGARSLRLSYTVRADAAFPVVGRAAGGVTVNPNGPLPAGVNSRLDVRQLEPGTKLLFSQGTAAFSSADLSYTQLVGPSGVLTADDRAFGAAAIQTLISTTPLTPEQVRQLNRLTPAQRSQLLAIAGRLNPVIRTATGGLTYPAMGVEVTDAALTASLITYSAILRGEQVLALPGAGGTVGRIKMSEDNSPIPRDRLIFTYDSFGGVPYTADGVGVNRYQFGVEKTFRDGLWSAEVRLPFAGTLASTYAQGAEMKDAELGNLRFAFKRLWVQTQRVYLSTGVAVTLPTADDQTVNSIDGQMLYSFKNESVQVEPFVGVLFLPTERLFAQTWASVNFDTSGGQLRWNPNVFGGSGSARVWDLPVVCVDGQLGYWLVQRPTGTLRGFAPFVELHYNQTVAQNRLTDEVSERTAQEGLTVSTIGATELNMTAGFLAQVGNNLNLSVGASFPLLNQPNRTYDWQVGVRVSYFFGRTAAARNPAYYASGF